MKSHRPEHPRNVREVRNNKRTYLLDKIRAGFICLGLALILFATMGWLSVLLALAGVGACVVIYEFVTRANAHDQDASTSSGEDNSA